MLIRRYLGLVLACASLAGASGAQAYSNQVACGNWTVGGINLGCAGPTTITSVGGFNDSAYWPGWALLSTTSGVDVNFNGKSSSDGGTATSQNGNIGIWGASKLYVQNDAVISGNVYFSSGAYGTPETKFDSSVLEANPKGSTNWTHVQGPNDFVANFTSDFLLWRAQQAAFAAATTAGSLAPSVTFSGNTSLTQNITLTATAANCVPIPGDPLGTCRVVVNFGGDLDLKNFTLTLDRGLFTNVDFVLNIANDLKGNGTSSIALAGGLAWSDVLINVSDQVGITSDTVSPLGDNRYSGILIAANDIHMSKTQWTGEVIGFHNMVFDNGSQITNPGGLISMVTFIPAPGTLLLLLLGGALGTAFRGFRPFGERSALQPAA